MPKSKANEEKAQFIFEQVFDEFKLDWKGPEFDFDSDRYKARVQSGRLKGQLVYLSVEKLEDRNREVSAENIKQQLLRQLNTQLTRNLSAETPLGTQIGYWKCIHCDQEHPVWDGGSTGCKSLCPKTGYHWISVLPAWVYENADELTEVQAS